MPDGHFSYLAACSSAPASNEGADGEGDGGRRRPGPPRRPPDEPRPASPHLAGAGAGQGWGHQGQLRDPRRRRQQARRSAGGPAGRRRPGPDGGNPSTERPRPGRPARASAWPSSRSWWSRAGGRRPSTPGRGQPPRETTIVSAKPPLAIPWMGSRGVRRMRGVLIRRRGRGGNASGVRMDRLRRDRRRTRRGGNPVLEKVPHARYLEVTG